MSTDTAPTEAGWYWCEAAELNGQMVVKVFGCGGKDLAAAFVGGGTRRVEAMECADWSARIPTPSELADLHKRVEDAEEADKTLLRAAHGDLRESERKLALAVDGLEQVRKIVNGPTCEAGLYELSQCGLAAHKTLAQIQEGLTDDD